MYKIMLADDEGIVLDSLKFIIEKEFGDEIDYLFEKEVKSSNVSSTVIDCTSEDIKVLRDRYLENI